jgi:hypothetical protein
VAEEEIDRLPDRRAGGPADPGVQPGERRRADTLSGGETFLASLALALLTAHQAVGAGSRAPWQLAKLAQQAENRFVGTQCGIMDQLASACGEAGHALLIDCRSLATQAVPLPAGVAVLIAHSRVRRGLVDSAYNERRRQCEQAAQVLGVPALRDATLPQLLAAQAQMHEAVFRRARHIVTENARDFRGLVGRKDLHPGLLILPCVSRDRCMQLLQTAIAFLETVAAGANEAPADHMINRVIEVDSAGQCRIYRLPEID